MFEIHQLVPNFYAGDAISSQVAELQEIFQKLGFTSRIFALSIDRQLRKKALNLKQYLKFSAAGNLVFYHFSDPSEATGFFKNLPDRKVLIYHNITPKFFFVEAGLYHPDDEGAELRSLAPLVEWAFGVSEFNRRPLVEAGFQKTGVLPIIFNPRKYDLAASQKIINKFRDGKDNFLFVGRIAPNKKIEDLLKIFYFYKNYLNPGSRLIIVGKVFELFQPYYGRLLKLVEELGLEDVVFTGPVSQAELVAYYQVASVYLSASEHEGFGVPFLEAMYFKVPIIAYSAAAIPETLGGAGLLYQEKNPQLVAELLNKIITGPELKKTIIQRQNQRLKNFYPEAVRKILERFLS